MKHSILLFIAISCIWQSGIAQGCCSGGSGSPVAGNMAQGVLAGKQMELSSSLQWMQSDHFKTGTHESPALFDRFFSRYSYNRIAYGITSQFTLSIEAGYYLQKTQVELNNTSRVSSSGIGDLIIFPRYDVFNKKTKKGRNELTLGLGFKIPLGSYNDSHMVFKDPNSGREYYTVSPPLVQTTTGSQDVIFYAFYMHGFDKQKMRFFTNAMYIKKGWNPLGQKFGNFSAVNLYLSKTLLPSLSGILQINAEHIDKMQHDKNIDMLALYNVDVNSTGSQKISLIPQASYTFNKITCFALAEIPLYQSVRGTQVSTQYQFTLGLSYRFFTTKNIECDTVNSTYMCKMKCKGGGSEHPGNCSVCGMHLEKVK